jgi:hypothetical protein
VELLRIRTLQVQRPRQQRILLQPAPSLQGKLALVDQQVPVLAQALWLIQHEAQDLLEFNSRRQSLSLSGSG